MEKPYNDIPGTIVFDADRSRQGYYLNQFCMSLMKPENRTVFKADQAAYLAKWPMTPEQRQAVLDRDFNRMLQLGGNIYFLAKIAATDGLTFRQVAAMMSGATEPEYAQMMLDGGRSPEGNRYLSEQKTGVQKHG
jgi:protocatechuate 4,5-dioxygenase alpha chain